MAGVKFSFHHSVARHLHDMRIKPTGWPSTHWRNVLSKSLMRVPFTLPYSVPGACEAIIKPPAVEELAMAAFHHRSRSRAVVRRDGW